MQGRFVAKSSRKGQTGSFTQRPVKKIKVKLNSLAAKKGKKYA